MAENLIMEVASHGVTFQDNAREKNGKPSHFFLNPKTRLALLLVKQKAVEKKRVLHSCDSPHCLAEISFVFSFRYLGAFLGVQY